MRALCRFARCCAGAGEPANRERQLLKHVQAHEQIAFRELVERLQTRVFSFCYVLLGNHQEADEAAQKVFVTLYRRAGQVGQQRDFMRCVYQLATDQCLAELRARRMRKFIAWFTGRASTPNALALSATDGNSEQRRLIRGLSMIPDNERVLLVLKEVADQPVDAIAGIMRMNLSAVRSRLFLARQKLRASLSTEAGEPGERQNGT